MTLLGFLFSVKLQAQVDTSFISPFKFPLLLSANFGELRPNHFHNGIDIKTQGVTGKPIYCIADGYVSRILVLHGGYGQALFVTHPNGYTSVYGHVVKFAPAIQKYLRAYQYEHETFVADVRPEPGELVFRQGELIALSGNEGASAGPHLHLELRRTDTGEYVDPLPFFKHHLKDSKAPTASLVAFYPKKGEGVVQGSSRKKLVPVGQLTQTFTAWGKISTGIAAKDYMDGTSNFYGVHEVTLYVDSLQVFHSVTDCVAADENRMINGFTDYEELENTRRLIMRSHRLPGNKLRLLQTAPGNGWVNIDEERDYHFRYVLRDGFGNKRSYSFKVRGKKQEIPAFEPDADAQHLSCNQTNVVQLPGMQMTLAKGMLYDDTWLKTNVVEDSSAISFSYRLEAKGTPLHTYCPISIGVRNLPVSDTEKYYVSFRRGNWSYSAGGTYKDGWMTAKVRDLGTYTVRIDTVPPVVTPLGKNTWRSTRNIRIKVKDNATGIATYKVYVDGKFVLFGLKKGVLVIQDPEKIKKEVPHKLELWVTDACGNETYRKYAF